jgi:hypothetical protein
LLRINTGDRDVGPDPVDQERDQHEAQASK